MTLPSGSITSRPSANTITACASRAIVVCEATRVFTLAESLGGVESLIELPAVMTHASVEGTPLEVPEALIRLSVGIEAGRDLVADLREALDRA